MRLTPGARQVRCFALFLVFGLLAPSCARAQVSVELAFSQGEYILFEEIVAMVKITNATGQPLDLARMAKDKPWIDFLIVSADHIEAEHTSKKWEPPP